MYFFLSVILLNIINFEEYERNCGKRSIFQLQFLCLAKENGNNGEAYELCRVKRAGKQSTASAEQFSCLDDDEKDLFASDEEYLIEEEDAGHEEAGTVIEGRTAEPKNDDPEKKNASDFKSLVRRFSKKGYEEDEAEESSEEEHEFIKPSPERYLKNDTCIKMKRQYASEAGSELVLVKNTEEITGLFIWFESVYLDYASGLDV